MKKTLLVLAAATALVFVLASCNTPANTDTTNSNTNTEATAETPTNEAEKTDEEAPAEETKTDETPATEDPAAENPAATEDPAENTDPAEDPAPAVENVVIDLSKATHDLASWANGWGESTNFMTKNDSGITITSGNGWANKVVIELDTPVDVSKLANLVIEASGKLDESENPSDLKVEIYSSDTEGSEMTKSYVTGFLDVTEESKEFSAPLASLGQLYGDTYTGKADLSAVNKIVINLQGNTGVVTIKSMSFKN